VIHTQGSVKVIAAFDRLLGTTGRNRALRIVETIDHYFNQPVWTAYSVFVESGLGGRAESPSLRMNGGLNHLQIAQ
jgi:hypothetical protein